MRCHTGEDGELQISPAAPPFWEFASCSSSIPPALSTTYGPYGAYFGTPRLKRLSRQ